MLLSIQKRSETSYTCNLGWGGISIGSFWLLHWFTEVQPHQWRYRSNQKLPKIMPLTPPKVSIGSFWSFQYAHSTSLMLPPKKKYPYNSYSCRIQYKKIHVYTGLYHMYQRGNLWDLVVRINRYMGPILLPWLLMQKIHVQDTLMKSKYGFLQGWPFRMNQCFCVH